MELLSHSQIDPQSQSLAFKLAASMAGIALASGISGCSSPAETAPAQEYLYVIDSIEAAPEAFNGEEAFAGAVAADPKLKKAIESPDYFDEFNLLTVGMADGQLAVTKLAEGVDRAAVRPLEAAVAQNAPWILAAMDAGTVKNVEFNFQARSVDEYNPDGTMQYIQPQSGEGEMADEGTLYYILPSSNEVSTRLITTMIRHESIHALTHNYSIIEPLENATRTAAEEVDIDADKYTTLCTELREQALQSMGADSYEMMDTLNDMREVAPNTMWDKALIAIRRSIANGNYADFQPKPGEEDWIKPSIVQACMVKNPELVLYHQMGYEPDLASGLTKLQKCVSPIYEAWNNYIGDQTLYSMLRENTYLRDVAADNSMGHPYDNLSELMASYLNVSTRYPQEVRDNIAGLPVEQQAVLKDLLQTISDDMISTYSDEPALVSEIQTAVDTIIAA